MSIKIFTKTSLQIPKPSTFVPQVDWTNVINVPFSYQAFQLTSNICQDLNNCSQPDIEYPSVSAVKNYIVTGGLNFTNPLKNNNGTISLDFEPQYFYVEPNGTFTFSQNFIDTINLKMDTPSHPNGDSYLKYDMAQSGVVWKELQQMRILTTIEHFFNNNTIPSKVWTTKTFTFTNSQPDNNYYVNIENTGDQCFVQIVSKTNNDFTISIYNNYSSTVNAGINILVYRERVVYL